MASSSEANNMQVHVVQFNNSGKIQQIRLYWDQGSLLKQVEVISARNRNWPIKNGEDQIKLIKTSASDPSSVESVSKSMGDVSITTRPASVSNPTRDPHASLALFGSTNEKEHDAMPDRPIDARRAGARPPTRDYTELFAAAMNDPNEREHSVSPQKEKSYARSGAGKNVQAPRIFDNENLPATIEPSPRKGGAGLNHSHFEFGDGTDEPKRAPMPARPRTKHDSQWGFEDFATPVKVPTRHRRDDEVNWGNGDDDDGIPAPVQKYGKSTDGGANNVTDGLSSRATTKTSNAGHLRRDAEPNFEFQDDGMPAVDRRTVYPRGQGSMNKNGHLYDSLYNENGMPPTPAKRNDGPTTTANTRERGQTFGTHFEIADDSQGLTERSANQNNRPQSVLGGSRTKGNKMFDQSWETGDASPASSKTAAQIKQANGKENGGISRKGAGQSNWSLTGEDEEAQGESNKKIYKTAGNGMGGRSGAGGRGWGIGDSDDESNAPTVQKHRQQTKSDAWEF